MRFFLWDSRCKTKGGLAEMEVMEPMKIVENEHSILIKNIQIKIYIDPEEIIADSQTVGHNCLLQLQNNNYLEQKKKKEKRTSKAKQFNPHLIINGYFYFHITPSNLKDRPESLKFCSITLDSCSTISGVK